MEDLQHDSKVINLGIKGATIQDRPTEMTIATRIPIAMTSHV
jgi:hypothetical protein